MEVFTMIPWLSSPENLLNFKLIKAHYITSVSLADIPFAFWLQKTTTFHTINNK